MIFNNRKGEGTSLARGTKNLDIRTRKIQKQSLVDLKNLKKKIKIKKK